MYDEATINLPKPSPLVISRSELTTTATTTINLRKLQSLFVPRNEPDLKVELAHANVCDYQVMQRPFSPEISNP
jgi:hypothetical protein